MELEHVALNAQGLSCAKALLQKSGLWRSFPYRSAIDKTIDDLRFIGVLMAMAVTRSDGARREG
jgi:hypothetical protein